MNYQNPGMELNPVEWPKDIAMSKHHVVDPGSKIPFSLYTVKNGKREKIEYYNKENGSTRFDFRVALELADFTINGKYYYSEVLADRDGLYYFLDPRQGNQYLQVIHLPDHRYVRYVVVTYNYIRLDKSLHLIRPQPGSLIQRVCNLELELAFMKGQLENVHSEVHGIFPVNSRNGTYVYSTDPKVKENLDYGIDPDSDSKSVGNKSQRVSSYVPDSELLKANYQKNLHLSPEYYRERRRNLQNSLGDTRTNVYTATTHDALNSDEFSSHLSHTGIESRRPSNNVHLPNQNFESVQRGNSEIQFRNSNSETSKGTKQFSFIENNAIPTTQVTEQIHESSSNHDNSNIFVESSSESGTDDDDLQEVDPMRNEN